MRRFFLLINIITFASVSAGGYAYSYKKNYESSTDWEKGVIKARAKADITADRDGMPVNVTEDGKSLNRERIASYKESKESAMELLLNRIGYLKVDSTKTFRNIIEESPYTKKELSYILADKCRYKQYPSDFHSTVTEASIKISYLINILPFDYPNREFPEIEKNSVPTDFTSLIVDARGLGFEPMIFPEIYSPKNEQVFGKEYVNIKYARKMGIASFCFSESEIQRFSNVGEHPYFAAAVSSFNGYPVLSMKDINRIFASKKTIENLKMCKVIFIIDKPAE